MLANASFVDKDPSMLESINENNSDEDANVEKEENLLLALIKENLLNDNVDSVESNVDDDNILKVKNKRSYYNKSKFT